MAVPSAITDLSTTVASNSPAGSESPSLIDDYLRAQAGFLAQMYSGNAPLLSSVAGTDTITGTVTPTPTAYAAGQVFRFISAGANTTTAVTLNVSSLGAKSVTKLGANALAAGDIPAGAVVQVVYDGTRFQIVGLTSQIAAAINTMTAPLTITVNGTTPITADTSGNISLPLGTANQVQYLSGSKVLSGSANLTFDGTTLTPNALTVTNAVTLSGGTANGVPYLNASKVLTTGNALTFDGLTLKATGNVQAGSGNISLEYSSLEGYLWTYAGNGLTFGVNNAQQARLTSTGLGIGTSSIVERLTIGGSGNIYASGGATWYTGGDLFIRAGASGKLRLGANNNNDLAILDTSGNLGLGVTPSAWSGLRAFEIGPGNAIFSVTGASLSQMRISSNAYYNGANWIYKNTGYAQISSLDPSNGSTVWFNAPSGTAGAAITFTQAMTLSATGNLQVPAMYATTVTTPRNVFIDASGNMGGISSVRASKSNITNQSNADWLYALSPVTFNYRKRDEDGNYLDAVEEEVQYGLIAEDVEAVKPEFCIYVNGKLSGVHYDRMVSPLIQALKDQKALIESLTSRIAALEAK